ncbi:MAG: CinA family nicotinamide mononucleotide deamidase-related protein [Chloroflexi bacterium]|nr:CinA family nicotinamide mononucleotide deamidase-related protein [Chloroflexota bacterium]
MNAEIVAIGSELLLGQIVDTNSAWMAQRLADLGVNLFYKTVVGDNPDRMLEITNRAMERSDLVITSGGLGPTQDDLTREIVARAANRDLVMDPELLAQIEARFRSRGMIMTENNNRQAMIPEGAIPVTNPNGTAPSFIVEDPRAVVYCLPGVPFEMKWLFDNELVPYLRGKFGLSDSIYSRVLKISDLGESGVDDLVGHLIANSVNPTVGVLAHPGQVDVRITAKSASREEADELIAPLEEEVRELLGGHVFGVDNETLPQVLGKLLRSRGLTVASYEGLTGGVIAQQLQDAGEELFLQGTVGRQPGVLKSVLSAADESSLSLDRLMGDGAALADGLAAGVRAQTGAALGLAVHSVPEGAKPTENLNPGHTYISVSSAGGTWRRQYNFAGPGLPDRTRTALNALDLLRVTILQDRYRA